LERQRVAAKHLGVTAQIGGGLFQVRRRIQYLFHVLCAECGGGW
jgi:hypothetical protein